MNTAVQLAGFSPSDSDRLRKAIGSKDDDLMSSMQTQFIDGCSDIPRETAAELWENIQYFGGYGFNKAHSTGYAVHTYETAYLKTHYPLEYYASLLSVAETDSKKKDKRRRYIADSRRNGISILPPDINTSTDHYTIVGEAICLPLIAVKQIGERRCEAIIAAREDGEFSSYSDFCARVPPGKVSEDGKRNLIKAGAFDRLHDRQELLQQLEISDPDVLALEFEVLGGIYQRPSSG